MSFLNYSQAIRSNVSRSLVVSRGEMDDSGPIQLTDYILAYIVIHIYLFMCLLTYAIR